MRYIAVLIIVVGGLSVVSWSVTLRFVDRRGRPHIGAADPPGKMDEKLINENMQKEQFSVFMLYFESNQGRQV